MTQRANHDDVARLQEQALLPIEVLDRIAELLRRGRNGKVEIDIRDGKVAGARVMDSIPFNKRVERG